MSCIHETECKCFPDKCFRCDGEKLFNNSKKSKTKIFERKQDYKTANEDNSWEDLEKQIAQGLNRIPTMKEARRARASGALWFEKGDVVDSILHPECKERTAEKSFSVKREWLEKALAECKYSDKTMCLPFRFKGDDQIYIVMRNQDIMELITMMKAYMQDNERMSEEIKMLRDRLEGQV